MPVTLTRPTVTLSTLALSLILVSLGCEDTPPAQRAELLWQAGPRAQLDLEPNLAGVTGELGGTSGVEEEGGVALMGGAGGAEAGASEGGTPAELRGLPRVILETPPRAHYTADASWLVEGYIEDERALTNGVSVDALDTSLEEDLTFSQVIELPHGPHIIESKAMIDGRMIATDYRTIVSGLHLPEEAPAPFAVAFQLSTSALNEIASRIDEFMTPERFNSVIRNPVLSEGFGGCFGFCAMGIEVYAWDPNFSNIFASVTPQDGYLMVTFVMEDFTMSWEGSARVSFAGYGGQGVMYARSIQVNMALGIDWNADVRRVGVLGTEVISEGVVYDFNDVFYQAMSSFGVPLDQFMTSMMESTFEDLLIAEVPPLVFEMLVEDAAIVGEVPVDQERVTLDGQIAELIINPRGVHMWYHMFATPSVKRHTDYSTRWYGDFDLAPLQGSSEALALFGLEGMNVVLHGVWQAGGVDFTLPGEQLGLTPEVMDQLIPGLGPVEVHVSALLPPLLTHNEVSAAPNITMGDIVMRVSARGAGADASLITVVSSIKGQLGIRTNGEVLIPELLSPEVYPTITQPTSVDPILALGLPTLLIPLVQEQLPLILAQRVVFPVDLIRGYRLDQLTAAPLNGLGYLLSGTIVERSSP